MKFKLGDKVRFTQKGYKEFCKWFGIHAWNHWKYNTLAIIIEVVEDVWDDVWDNEFDEDFELHYDWIIQDEDRKLNPLYVREQDIEHVENDDGQLKLPFNWGRR